MDGWVARSLTPGTGPGTPPVADTRQRIMDPPRLEKNTISLPSGVQAEEANQALSKVTLRGSPPVTGQRTRLGPGRPRCLLRKQLLNRQARNWPHTHHPVAWD